jgi:hypothetical protein
VRPLKPAEPYKAVKTEEREPVRKEGKESKGKSIYVLQAYISFAKQPRASISN